MGKFDQDNAERLAKFQKVCPPGFVTISKPAPNGKLSVSNVQDFLAKGYVDQGWTIQPKASGPIPEGVKPVEQPEPQKTAPSTKGQGRRRKAATHE